MSELVIIGAGGHGKVVYETALAMNKWNKLAFLDDTYPDKKTWMNMEIIGTLQDLDKLDPKQSELAIALGDNWQRLKLLEQILSLGFDCPNLIHPTAIISPSAQMGCANVILAGCIIQADVKIGDACILNTRSLLEHDCQINDGVHVSPGALLAGGVCVGKGSWIGMGAKLLENITVGCDAMVGAGAVVLNAVGDAQTVVGVPAKRFKIGALDYAGSV